MLLGEARARADSATAALGAAEPTLVAAARVRLTACADAAGAVTRSLQVLGGSGYMEDFPLAKRLRDVEVLRISQGTPDDLRRILAADLARHA
jgi:alkylation response protein AidB-like acyl-CoA dehydrogenase